MMRKSLTQLLHFESGNRHGPRYPPHDKRCTYRAVHALEANNLKRGVAALCISGGEATAIAVERILQ
jgi:hypothetical protein